MLQPITNCTLAEQAVHDEMHGLDHEEVWALFISSSGALIAKEMISKGTLTRTSIDNFTVLRRALLNNAARIIILHNHPSGNHEPSPADISWTGKLRQACDIMNIQLLDHIIVTDDSFYSFNEEKSHYYGTFK